VSDSYDDVPYTSHAYAEAHPDRLAVVAKMSGWDAPAIEDARILEIGCGVGGHLLPMAEQLPRATLVGIDRSTRQIAMARTLAEKAGVTNVSLHDASFEDVPLTAASFDFVIAHGVYSWIAVETRRAMLRAIARALSPRGIAYVSFNTLPGWYQKMAARDWLRFAPTMATSGASALSWLMERASPELDTYRRDLDRVVARLNETEAAYLLHEYLSEENRPELASTVLAEADAAGLRYLGDAIPSTVAIEMLDDEAQARARGLDAVNAQQLVDFVRNTSFRRALFVRADDAGDWRWPHARDPRAIDGLRVASRLRIAGDAIEGPDGSVHVDNPAARAAFRALADAAPRSLAFDALCGASDRDAVRAEIFDVWLAIGGLDLHAFEPRIADASRTPKASAVARHARGPITNAWHQEVRVEDIVRFVLARLDGTRDVAAIARDVRGALAAGTLAFEGRSGAIANEDAEALVRASIDLLAKNALLV
jgi:ubiquinone/menaquinone biosynthesis C-methylase UbiE